MDLEVQMKSSVRPDGDEDVRCGVCNEEVNGLDSDADDEHEEGMRVKSVRNVYLPSQQEIEEHELTCLPFRDWCPHCVQGKGVSAAHRKRKKEETQIPVISMDYMGLTKREPEEGENPIIVIVDRKSKMKHANVIKNKGNEDHYAVERVALDIINMGYSHFVFKTDQEPAILTLKEAVIRRITALKGDGVQIIPEVSPVGESQSNGEVENAVKQIQGQFRTIRSQLHAKCLAKTF